jgi:hypothetical protein
MIWLFWQLLPNTNGEESVEVGKLGFTPSSPGGYAFSLRSLCQRNMALRETRI